MAWPTHADGRNKKVGEMTETERREVFAAASKRTQQWFDRPEVKAGIAAALSSEAVKPT